MYKLYWAADSGALAPQIILEESAVDYERCAVDLDQGEEMEPAFLAINPRGQVPALPGQWADRIHAMGLSGTVLAMAACTVDDSSRRNDERRPVQGPFQRSPVCA